MIDSQMMMDVLDSPEGGVAGADDGEEVAHLSATSSKCSQLCTPIPLWLQEMRVIEEKWQSTLSSHMCVDNKAGGNLESKGREQRERQLSEKVGEGQSF